MQNYFLIRNGAYTRTDIRGINDHNERRKETYRNADIDISRSSLNLHFRAPYSSYTKMLDKMVSDGAVSLRGLKGDAILFDEFIMDVNSKYFEEHGGYDAAKRFYGIAYQFCCEEIGEENILSAVMHADERNKMLGEEYGHDVWHYHLHVVYLPTVKKEIRYTKRCKDPELVGKVKEVVNQVSHSKRWTSAPMLDENGKPIRDGQGKVVLAPSYGELQTRFAKYMQAHGYTDIERGIAGKKARHKEITEYKLGKDQERAKMADEKATQLELANQKLEADIAEQEAVLTELRDANEYMAEVARCKSLLQRMFDSIAEYLRRSTLLRDKRAENVFFERLRGGLTEFFDRLRNILGFELVVDMPVERCESPRLAEEGRKMALEIKIAEANQRTDSTAKPTARKENER